MFKKIELFGFKSFADRLAVDFSGGITCIVGPNGCGKSNVSDAIRWVLGEQSSRQLRGTNMQDVIFKGTDNRKQLGYCEVSLHFDNTNKIFPVDYEEVVLGRKLYRSGESEYLLNNTEVRLKDIVTLLHDSGIDRDGLTIIGQGNITEIVTANAVERRAIFEEAAGISKVKAREKEAARKLERVTIELDKVKNVIEEIERNLGPLLKQAENAKRYLELSERLKHLEINHYIHSYDSASSVKDELTKELEQISTQLNNKQQEVDELSKGSSRGLDQLSTLDSRAEFLRDQVLTLSLGLERHSGEQKLARERGERIQFEQANLQSAKDLYNALETELESVSAKLEKAKQNFDNASHTEHERIALKSHRERLLARREAIVGVMEGGDSLKPAVKRILDSNNPRVIGVFKSLITVPAHLDVAIEVALGAAAQNLITNTEDDARAVIEIIKRERWGRATFLPLSSAKVRLFTNQERMDFEHECVIGIASELVTHDKKISNAVSCLLGRIVIVDVLENAIELAKYTNYGFKIVTLEGDVIEPRGTITGGGKHTGHAAVIAQIEKDLASVDEKLTLLGEVNIHELNSELTTHKIRAVSIKSELESIATQIEKSEQTISSISAVFETAEDLHLHNEAITRLENAREELSGFDSQKDELRKYIAWADEEKTKATNLATELYQDYYKAQNKLDRVDIELTQMQEEIYNTYGLNYSSCYEFRAEDFEPESAVKEIGELKRAISRLGPVNIDAIELSKDASERFNSYSTQVNDLESARADLEKVISDLAIEMESKFKQTFETVNRNFGETFSELFGGGRARLELVDNNWLEGGIEIIAEPPGKRLQSLNLLSGGEKALTAIAILFAILKLKPMPFCLLDEIEAALDEANVVRFASYLQKFAGNTQFIVITHRKPTMELGDRLFGVTMEERGVSKLVSVKLEAYA